MKNVLAEAQRDALARLAWSNVLLGFDFDGTLAPTVLDPLSAMLRDSTRGLLDRLARLYPCVVISGRAVADIELRMAGIALRSVIGNHGLEPWRASDEMRFAVVRWKARLAPLLAELRGVEMEDKTYSLSVHYRRARQKRLSREAILRAVELLDGVRVIPGKQVVNLLTLDAPHKGIALERERERLGCDSAFFVGDDETDEDVFALDRSEHLFTVRVGARRASRAMYFVRDQREVDELLRRLIELRSELGQREAR